METEIPVGVENKSICTKCGGVCCKNTAGLAVPSDFGRHYQQIKKNVRYKLETERWVLDCWDGPLPEEDQSMSQVYFVRPRHKNAGWPFDASWGGICVFFTDSGCELSLGNRPIGCRMLVPVSKKHSCDYPKGQDYHKEEVARLWLPYQKLLIDILSSLREGAN